MKMNPKTRSLAQYTCNFNTRVLFWWFPSFSLSSRSIPSPHLLRTSLPRAEEDARGDERGEAARWKCKRTEKIGNRCEIALAGCMPGSQDYLRRVITARGARGRRRRSEDRGSQ